MKRGINNNWMCYRCFWEGPKSKLKRDARIKSGVRCPKCGSMTCLFDRDKMSNKERLETALKCLNSTLAIPENRELLLVQELKTILGDDDVIEVLEVLMKICSECWDNIKPCWCWK